jgi:hypothetical protein
VERSLRPHSEYVRPRISRRWGEPCDNRLLNVSDTFACPSRALLLFLLPMQRYVNDFERAVTNHEDDNLPSPSCDLQTNGTLEHISESVHIPKSLVHTQFGPALSSWRFVEHYSPIRSSLYERSDELGQVRLAHPVPDHESVPCSAIDSVKVQERYSPARALSRSVAWFSLLLHIIAPRFVHHSS